jgi:hypothetical protein
VKLSDGEGLQLWITPNGSKLRRLAYRLDGKQRKLSIGAYPAVEEREDAAAQFERLGQTDRAAALRFEATLARQYLG